MLSRWACFVNNSDCFDHFNRISPLKSAFANNVQLKSVQFNDALVKKKITKSNLYKTDFFHFFTKCREWVTKVIWGFTDLLRESNPCKVMATATSAILDYKSFPEPVIALLSREHVSRSLAQTKRIVDEVSINPQRVT